MKNNFKNKLMENLVNNSKKEKQRKFLTALPIMVLPFITLMFWAMGGGKVEQAEAGPISKKGLNNILPDAHLKDDNGLDKMSYYDKAGKDSARLAEASKTDPYYQQSSHDTQLIHAGQYQSPYSFGGTGGLNTGAYPGAGYNDANEARVYEKLQQLDQALRADNAEPVASGQRSESLTGAVDGDAMRKLERMMQQMQSGGSEKDPETEQLNDMLEKVLDIQNPERVQEKLRKTSEERRNQVFAVNTPKKKEIISLLEGKEKDLQDIATAGNGFYGLDEPIESEEQNAIDAVVHDTRTLVNGATVKLRLIDDVYINGKLLKKDNFIYGTAALNGERLNIKVTGIRFKKSAFPVALSVIDIDGMEGIYIPGAIARDVAKQSTERAIQDVGFGSMSNSIGIQAAGAGIEAAKTLFSKKVKLIKVTVKAGYRVLLRDDKQKMEQQ
jgi:conjugative transposon TraM protein